MAMDFALGSATGADVPPTLVMVARYLWGMGLFSQVILTVVGLLGRLGPPSSPMPVSATTWAAIDAGLLLAVFGVVAVFDRAIVPADAGRKVVLRHYIATTFVPLLGFHGVSGFGLLGLLATRSAYPVGIVPVIAFVAQLRRFPPTTIAARA